MWILIKPISSQFVPLPHEKLLPHTMQASHMQKHSQAYQYVCPLALNVQNAQSHGKSHGQAHTHNITGMMLLHFVIFHTVFLR